MRAYFDKLLSSYQQQKPLPLIYPVLIALFAGAIFQFGTSPLSLLVAGDSVSSTALCLPART